MINGFESDESLIGYCEIHCETERALFHVTQINEMIKLAGYPKGFMKEISGEDFYSLHGPMEELCKLARARIKKLNEPPPDNVISLAVHRNKLNNRVTN